MRGDVARTQDLRAVVMGVLVGPAAAAAADVLKVFTVSARAARLVMSKVDRMNSVKPTSRDNRLFPQRHSCKVFRVSVASRMLSFAPPETELV